MFKVNQRFAHRNSGDVYMIKGAWDGKYPNNSHCFLMNENFKGHAYAGKVTPVKSVWHISNDEFCDMTGHHPDWFLLIEEPPAERGEPAKQQPTQPAQNYCGNCGVKLQAITSGGWLVRWIAIFCTFELQFGCWEVNVKIKQYAGLMALAIYSTGIKMPFYSDNSNYRGYGRFDPKEIEKARKRRTRKKKRK